MVARIVGPKLLAFQFDNEPDGFHTDIRKSNYNSADYITEWREFLKALRTRVPGAALAGPDIASCQSTREVFDRGCERSPCAALAANIESF
jgi:hypothetical protein